MFVYDPAQSDERNFQRWRWAGSGWSMKSLGCSFRRRGEAGFTRNSERADG